VYPIAERHLAAIGVQPARISTYLLPLNDAMREYGITTGERPAMFVAQIAHESGLFRYVAELWGPTPQQRRYDDGGALSISLGNPSGEGEKWKGHGLIQITGYTNHLIEAQTFKIPISDIAAWLQTPEGACRSAAHYWAAHGCNEAADQFDFVGVTKRINGGLNGLTERTQLYKILSDLK